MRVDSTNLRGDVLLLGAASFGALSVTGLCATGWWRDHSDEPGLEVKVDETRSELHSAQLELHTSRAPKADLALAPVPQLDAQLETRLQTTPGSPMPCLRRTPTGSTQLGTDPVLQLDQTQGAPLKTPPGSPHAAPGSAERWNHEMAEAMAAEAAAAAYVSESESATPSPRLTVTRPAHIVEADDKELELEIDGHAYLVDRTSSLVFSLDGCPAEPQTIGTWDEEASSVSFYLDEEEKTAQDEVDTVATTICEETADGAAMEVETNTSSSSISASTGSSPSSPPVSVPRVTFQVDAAAAPSVQRAAGAAVVAEASSSPPSATSAAGTSPSPPPVSAPRVSFQLQTSRQSHAVELQHELDRVSYEAKNREKELLARLAKMDSALVRVRAESAATEAAKWRREIGEERISAAHRASALQAQQARATRQCSELQLHFKTELETANRCWRRKIGAERIWAAKEMATRDRQQTAAAKIQACWHRRHLTRDLRKLVQASAARHTRVALHATVDVATDLDTTATILHGELDRERAATAASLEENRAAAAVAKELHEALIDRLDQVRVSHAKELQRTREEAARQLAIHERALVTAADEKGLLQTQLADAKKQPQVVEKLQLELEQMREKQRHLSRELDIAVKQLEAASD